MIQLLNTAQNVRNKYVQELQKMKGVTKTRTKTPAVPSCHGSMMIAKSSD